MNLKLNKYQTIMVSIIVVIAMLITGTAVFLITSCSKSDKKNAETTSDVKTTKAETTTAVREVVLYVNDKEGVNLREKPSAESKLLETLGFGEKVISDRTEGDWTHVKVGNKVGYVKSSFLATEKEYKTIKKKQKKGKSKYD